MEEALTVEAIKRLQEDLTSLPLALQQAVLDWSDDFIKKKDKLHQRLMKLQTIDQAEKPLKSARLGFEVRATEAVKDVCKNEYAVLCTATEEAKDNLGRFIKQVIL